MNCRTFEENIIEIASGHYSPQTCKHIEACPYCANLLREELSLRKGLDAVIAATSDAGAPARVELALLSIFQEQAQSDNRSAFISTPIYSRCGANGFLNAATIVQEPDDNRTVHMSRPTNIRPRAYGLLKAAAIVLILLPGPIIFLLKSSWSGHGNKVVDQPIALRVAAPPGDREPKMIERQITGGKTNNNNNKTNNRAWNRPPVVYHSHRRRNDVAGVSTANEEVVTEFFPLIDEGAFDWLDSGQIVRVELPASALISLGVLGGLGKMDKPIKSDVLLGQDGVAYAMRFVK